MKQFHSCLFLFTITFLSAETSPFLPLFSQVHPPIFKPSLTFPPFFIHDSSNQFQVFSELLFEDLLFDIKLCLFSLGFGFDQLFVFNSLATSIRSHHFHSRLIDTNLPFHNQLRRRSPIIFFSLSFLFTFWFRLAFVFHAQPQTIYLNIFKDLTDILSTSFFSSNPR